MRKILLGSVALAALASLPANAADIPVAPAYRAPVIAAPLVYNWTGFYIGGNVGWGSTRDDFGDRFNGVIGGAQLGANWQMSNFVVGLETDIQWSDQKASDSGVTAKVRWFGTARARAGVAFDSWLFYATGGFAYADTSASASGVTGSSTKGGWAAGGGIEKALSENLSVKVEYLHRGFNNVSFGIPGLSAKLDDDIIRVGINYKFGGGPVVARY